MAAKQNAMKQRLIQVIQLLPDPVAHDRVIRCLRTMEMIGMDCEGGADADDRDAIFSTYLGELQDNLQQLSSHENAGGDGPTISKERLFAMINKLEPDARIGQLIYKVALAKEIQIGISELDRGEGIDHDELFDGLLRDDAA